ncbi:hypothetical protein [Clostridium sp.]|uniref:hypothetical protein n=1 Tax=Clostridium sp. TaxID=1506 RepID=UPI0032180A42
MPIAGEKKTKTLYITDYKTLMNFRDKFKDEFALGNANSCVVFLDFEWIYNGYNKQYWRLTNQLSTIMEND